MGSSKTKGIILAGGTGSRLYPVTLGLSKQLLPVYDKPMIYYPLTTLMLAGVREILIITTVEHKELFVRLLGDGSQWGISLSYAVQDRPEGLAQALIIAQHFLCGDQTIMILGDNLFFGQGLPNLLKNARLNAEGATIFGYHVNDPKQYGVVEIDDLGNVISIIEKPTTPASNYAVTGIYIFDNDVSEMAKEVKKSKRGEYEITSLLELYRKRNILNVSLMGRGIAWFDTGTHASLLDAGNFVRTISDRQGLQVGSPDEVAYHMGWISKEELFQISQRFGKNDYGLYLKRILVG